MIWVNAWRVVTNEMANYEPFWNWAHPHRICYSVSGATLTTYGNKTVTLPSALTFPFPTATIIYVPPVKTQIFLIRHITCRRLSEFWITVFLPPLIVLPTPTATNRRFIAQLTCLSCLSSQEFSSAQAAVPTGFESDDHRLSHGPLGNICKSCPQVDRDD